MENNTLRVLNQIRRRTNEGRERTESIVHCVESRQVLDLSAVYLEHSYRERADEVIAQALRRVHPTHLGSAERLSDTKPLQENTL